MNPLDETLHALLRRLMEGPAEMTAAAPPGDRPVSFDRPESEPGDVSRPQLPVATALPLRESNPGRLPDHPAASPEDADYAPHDQRSGSPLGSTLPGKAPFERAVQSRSANNAGQLDDDADSLPRPRPFEALAGDEAALPMAAPESFDRSLSDRLPSLERRALDAAAASGAAPTADSHSSMDRTPVRDEGALRNDSLAIESFAAAPLAQAPGAIAPGAIASTADASTAADRLAASAARAAATRPRPPRDDPHLATLLENSRTAAESIARLAERLEQLEAAHFARARL